MEVILLRHSIAVGNGEHRFLGRTDVPLTPEGIALAKARAKELPQVEHVYASPMTRAKETAALIWPGVPTTECAGLCEVDFGMLENKTHSELVGDAAYEAWLQAGGGEGYPGGESFFGFEKRVKESFFDLLKDAYKNGYKMIAVVTHGGVVMKLAEMYHLADKTTYETLRVSNCGGFRVVVNAEKGCAESIDNLKG